MLFCSPSWSSPLRAGPGLSEAVESPAHLAMAALTADSLACLVEEGLLDFSLWAPPPGASTSGPMAVRSDRPPRRPSASIWQVPVLVYTLLKKNEWRGRSSRGEEEEQTPNLAVSRYWGFVPVWIFAFKKRLPNSILEPFFCLAPAKVSGHSQGQGPPARLWGGGQ